MRAADGACCRHEHWIERSGARNIGVFTLVERAHYVHASRHMVIVTVVEHIVQVAIFRYLLATKEHLFISKPSFIFLIQLIVFFAATDENLTVTNN